MTTNRHALRLGYWSALVCGLGAAGYGVMNIFVALTDAKALDWGSLDQFLAHYQTLPTLLTMTPPFLVALTYPVLAAALYGAASEERKPYATVALVFAGMYAAILGSAYWVQLTFVPQSILEGSAGTIQLAIVWHPRGVFWAFESFGYFAMGVSCAFAALSLAPESTGRFLRLRLLALAPLGVLFMVNEAAGDWSLAFFMVLFLVFGWVILFSSASFSLSRVFRRRLTA